MSGDSGIKLINFFWIGRIKNRRRESLGSHILIFNYLLKAKTQHTEYAHKSRYRWNDPERKWLFTETIFWTHWNPVGDHQTIPRIRRGCPGIRLRQIPGQKKEETQRPQPGNQWRPHTTTQKGITSKCSANLRDRINTLSDRFIRIILKQSKIVKKPIIIYKSSKIWAFIVSRL